MGAVCRVAGVEGVSVRRKDPAAGISLKGGTCCRGTRGGGRLITRVSDDSVEPLGEWPDNQGL